MAALAGVAFAGGLRAQNPSPNLAGASLEDLLNTEVTSVSKKEQPLGKTGAAVFVISQGDIRRSGANNIPDLLRMVPGVEVAQNSANQWAVSIRGFNAVYSNKVLVLIDGRTVYLESFSGVSWDQMSVPLEDIERIEVIRGPGGTVWGANAVNGVINIITKNSADTKGGLVVAGGGSAQAVGSLVQYGGDAGSSGAYRAFGRYTNAGSSVFPNGLGASDGWHTIQAGFRSDWRPTSRDSVTVEGNLFRSQEGDTMTAASTAPLAMLTSNTKIPLSSGDVMARWVHTLANGSETIWQFYDNYSRHTSSGLNAVNNAVDLEFQHHIRAAARHDLVWGADYRFSYDSLVAKPDASLHVTPVVRANNLLTAFVQDEVTIGKSLFVTVGSKFEHNSYTGFEVEPSIQAVWTAGDHHSFWASAARAIREPDHIETGLLLNETIVPAPGFGSALVTVNGNPHIQAEHLNDFEVGYRGEAGSRFSFDLTGFASFYESLTTLEPQSPFITSNGGTPLLVLPLIYANLGHARTYGMEVFANWTVNRRWKISPGYSMLRMTTGTDPSSQDTTLAKDPGESPKYQPQIRSALTLSRNIELDSSAKFVSRLEGQNVPGYLRFDTRLGWRIGESVEVSLTGQNLTSPRHVEFVDDSGFFGTTAVRRSIFGKVTWRF
jgi:iron complex outermembrane recepter protein